MLLLLLPWISRAALATACLVVVVVAADSSDRPDTMCVAVSFEEDEQQER